MTPLEIGAIFGAGLAAGTINTIVGSGSLITFPTLLAFGFRPLDANVSNTIGLVPGSVSGAFGYRRELTGQRSRATSLGISCGAGGLTGAALLLAFPGAFEAIVPILIAVALILVATGPRLSKALSAHRHAESHRSWLLAALFFATSVYGGYFGAGMINGVAGILFIAIAPVHWDVALLIAAGSIVGGQIGSRVGRRLPAPALRLAIICVGLIAEARLLLI